MCWRKFFCVQFRFSCVEKKLEKTVEENANFTERTGGVLKYFCVALSSDFGVPYLRALPHAGDWKHDKRAGKARVDFRLFNLSKNDE